MRRDVNLMIFLDVRKALEGIPLNLKGTRPSPIGVGNESLSRRCRTLLIPFFSPICD